jgi:hypothetical protein
VQCAGPTGRPVPCQLCALRRRLIGMMSAPAIETECGAPIATMFQASDRDDFRAGDRDGMRRFGRDEARAGDRDDLRGGDRDGTRHADHDDVRASDGDDLRAGDRDGMRRSDRDDARRVDQDGVRHIDRDDRATLSGLPIAEPIRTMRERPQEAHVQDLRRLIPLAAAGMCRPLLPLARTVNPARPAAGTVLLRQEELRPQLPLAAPRARRVIQPPG